MNFENVPNWTISQFFRVKFEVTQVLTLSFKSSFQSRIKSNFQPDFSHNSEGY